MLSCERAATLASESMDRPLTLRERLSLHAHLAMCRLCRRFVRQLRFLRLAGAKAQQRSGLIDIRLGDDAKERIRRRILAGL